MKTLILLLVALCTGRPLTAQGAETQERLIAARDTIWRAWFSYDTVLLKRFLPPAAATLETGNAPRWQTRAEIVADSKRLASSKAKLVDLTFDNTQIVHSGTSALVRSNYRTVVEAGGRRDTTHGRATELFVEIGNTWVNPYWQLEPATSLRDAGRMIPLPDTLGANFSIADSAAMAGTLADYDALIGTWEFRYQGRRADGSFNSAFTGHWSFEKKPGGGLIEDRWRPDDPSSLTGISLYTYRVFDPKRKVWQMIGTSSNGGEVQPGLTWSDAAHRFAIQRDRGTLTRIRYLQIDADHFLWRSDRSRDGGRTWLNDAGTMEATRIGK